MVEKTFILPYLKNVNQFKRNFLIKLFIALFCNQIKSASEKIFVHEMNLSEL